MTSDYARLLPVPLTTLRQPTQQIGDTALSVMLERVARRDLVPRHVYLQAKLVDSRILRRAGRNLVKREVRNEKSETILF